MSLETEIAELRGTVTALIEIVTKQVAIQERLAAGAQAALEKVDAGKPAATGRGRKPKDTPPTSEEPAATESGADAADSASETPTPTPTPAPAATEKPKATFADFAKKFLGSAEDEGGKEAYKARGKALMSILANFGAGKISELDKEHQATAAWFIRRFKAGMPLNFQAAYDFKGDPAQPEPVAAEPEPVAAEPEAEEETDFGFDD